MADEHDPNQYRDRMNAPTPPPQSVTPPPPTTGWDGARIAKWGGGSLLGILLARAIFGESMATLGAIAFWPAIIFWAVGYASDEKGQIKAQLPGVHQASKWAMAAGVALWLLSPTPTPPPPIQPAEAPPAAVQTVEASAQPTQVAASVAPTPPPKPAGHQAIIQKAFGQAGSGDLKTAIATLYGVPKTSPDYQRAQGKISDWQGKLRAADAARQEAARRAEAERQAAAEVQEDQVWVNGNTGVYHNSGCRWYNNTASGYFAKRSEAYGRPCKKCGG